MVQVPASLLRGTHRLAIGLVAALHKIVNVRAAGRVGCVARRQSEDRLLALLPRRRGCLVAHLHAEINRRISVRNLEVAVGLRPNNELHRFEIFRRAVNVHAAPPAAVRAHIRRLEKRNAGNGVEADGRVVANEELHGCLQLAIEAIIEALADIVVARLGHLDGALNIARVGEPAVL